MDPPAALNPGDLPPSLMHSQRVLRSSAVVGRHSSNTNNVLASCRSKLSFKPVVMLLLLAGPLLQFRSLQVYLSNESFTKKVKKTGGAHNVVEEGSKKGSDGAMMTKRLRDHSSSGNNDNIKSKKAQTLTLDTKIVSFILLSLMADFVIPKFLYLPGNITWQSIRAQFCTSLMFQFQGLMTLQANDGRTLAMLKGVAGAGLEGIFLLSLMIMLLSKRRLWANVLVCVLGIVSIMCLYSTVTFMRKTGSPSLPEMSMVISGLRDARSYIKAEGKDDMRAMIKGVLGAYVSGVPSAILVWSVGRRDDNATLNNRRAPNVEQHRISNKQCCRSVLYFSVLFMALAILYCYDAWAPIFHIYASVCGSFIFPPPGSSEAYTETIEQGKPAATADSTNLILLIHDSLSGEYAMTRKEAVEKMPFLQKKFQSNDGDFFVFENARTVSGDTIDCVPAIVSGCLPLNKREGAATAYSTNMATQAKMRGYQTLSFSSSSFSMKGTRYWMIQDALSINFDQIWHPGVTGEPLVNEAAQSDRLMGKHFESWIREWNQNSTTKTPFFAQFYYYGAHHPYYSENKTSSNRLDDRLNEMLKTVDKGIEDIFGYLDDARQLDNTIVVVSGDHGDMYKEHYGRLHIWDADVLRPLMFMYVPKRLSTKYPEIVTNLNHNRQQLVSTLDLFPTMLHMLDGISSEKDYDGVTDFNCMRGYDLLSKKIDSERVAWSFPSDLYPRRGIIGVHYRRSSLVNRFGWPKRNHLEVITYNEAIGSLTENEKEAGDDDVLTFDEWKSIVLVKGTNGLHGMPNVGMNSPSVKYLIDSLDRSAELAQSKLDIEAKLVVHDKQEEVKEIVEWVEKIWCGSCKFQNTDFTCDKRVAFLVDKYHTNVLEAKKAIVAECHARPNLRGM